MKHMTKKMFALLLACAMPAAMIACSSNEESTGSSDATTAGITTASVVTQNPNASVNQKPVSDYEVEVVKNRVVGVGTSLDDVIADLPSELEVTIPGDAVGESTPLYSTDFSSADAFAEEWTACDNDGVITVGDGKFAVAAKSNKVKAYVTDPEWALNDTVEYANYAIKAVIRGTAPDPYNNFGIFFRASNISASGPDSYSGMYVGIGDPSGQICIGKAFDNKWYGISTVDFDYVPNQDYTLEVIVYNELFAVLLDGQLMYEGDIDPLMINGTVGLRTFEQFFECSEFSVRTLGADDFSNFSDGYIEVKTLPVVWTCSDYDPNKTGTYGFFGTITEGLPAGKQAQVKVNVSVRAS